MKEKIKLIIVFIIGIVISVVISVSAATVITASEVSYTSNSNTTVQTGLNNLYTNVNSLANRVTTLETYSELTGMSRNTTNTSNENIYGYKVGKVVTVSGWFQIKSGIATKSVIATGLPAPKVNVTVMAYDQNNDTGFALYIASGSTNMTLEYAIGSHATHYVNISTTHPIQ